MKIAILGGGFNPPHLGHLLICQQILDFTDNVEVWFLPYFAHPWEKPSLDPLHRLKMCQFLENGKIHVSDFEMKMKKKNYTFETVDSLICEYPQHDFSWVIGSDLWREFMTWENAKTILNKMHLLVFPRAGYPLGDLPDNVSTIKNKLLATSDISSEKIREMVKQGFSVKGLVLPEVEKYIKENGLYK